MVWEATGYWTLTWAILLLLQGVLPVAIVYLTRWLVDGLVAAVEAGGSWDSVQPTLILVGCTLYQSWVIQRFGNSS